MCKSEPKKTVTGVYGGSYNPIHLGHTSMASAIIAQGLVDEMWLVVSPQNPLKDGGLWDDAFRLELARIAVRDIESVEVSDVEFGLPKPNYMVRTLDTLSSRFPDREFVLVIGQDNWECFHRWYKWEEILAGYRIIVLPRESGETPANVPLPPKEDGNAHVLFADLPLVNISSTWIRAEIKDNPLYDGEWLAPEVWERIKSEKH
ncbi:MAG: nicotinate (nicotinamide) nucleotide adenylyltransferase [Bacteroidaceae bacterium]|nr:nicotinate (nicotinamide) nucleotide adenylyltransferase [Bacteroidaceae bacterium]